MMTAGMHPLWRRYSDISGESLYLVRGSGHSVGYGWETGMLWPWIAQQVKLQSFNNRSFPSLGWSLYHEGWSPDHECWLPKLFRVEDNATPQERKTVNHLVPGLIHLDPFPSLTAIPACSLEDKPHCQCLYRSSHPSHSTPPAALHSSIQEIKKEQTPPKSRAAKFQYQNTTTRIWEKTILTSFKTQMLNSWTRHWYTKSRNKQKREYTRPVEILPRNSRLSKYF